MNCDGTVVPSVVNVELTNKCNLECVFCDRSDLKQAMNVGEMDEELLVSILDSLKTFKIYELGLVGLGEPLLSKNLKRYLVVISQYKEIFKRISINTNGIMLDSAKAELVLNAPINMITFSLNATNRKSYNKLMGRDRFDIVVNNIKKFLSIRKECNRKDMKVSIQFMSSYLNDEKEMNELFSEYIDDNVIAYNRYVFSKPSINERGKGMLNVNPVDKSSRHPCWSMYSRVYIDINGNVYPCTIGNDSYREKSNLNIGNVREKKLITIFNNSKIENARKAAKNNKIPFVECLDCTIWELLPNNFCLKSNKWIFKEKEPVRRNELNIKD